MAKRGTPGWRGYATAVALTATVVLLCVAINSWMDGPPILISITQAVIAGGTLLVLIFVALALFAIRRDFAGRELAEAELDRFFSLSFDFLTIASADGYFRRVSPASQELLGWTPEEPLAVCAHVIAGHCVWTAHEAAFVQDPRGAGSKRW